MDLFSFYAVDDGVQHGEAQQVDFGHEDMRDRASMLAIPVNHGQASCGDVQDQDCQDTGQAVVQSLRCSLWDVMLRMALAISIYDTKMRMRSNVRKGMATAKSYQLLNGMSAHLLDQTAGDGSPPKWHLHRAASPILPILALVRMEEYLSR